MIIVVSLVLLVNFTIMLLIIISLFYYREYFPIKERSPQLTTLALIGLYISMEVQPIMILTQGETLTQDNQRFIISIWALGMQIFSECVCMKLLRLGYAMNMKTNTLNFLFSREWLLTSIIMLQTITTILFIIFQVQIVDNYCYWNQVYYIAQFFTTFTCVIALLIGYIIRKIDNSYRLKEECIYLYFMFSTMLACNYWMITEIKKDINNVEELFLWLYISLIIQYYVYIAFAVIFPLKNASVYHIKPSPRIILHDFKLFIQDQTCIKIFYKYLKYLDTNQDTLDELSRQVQLSGSLGESVFGPLGEMNFAHPFQYIQQEHIEKKGSSESVTNFLKNVQIEDNNFHVNIFSFYCDVIQNMEEKNILPLRFVQQALQEYFVGDKKMCLTRSLIKKLSEQGSQLIQGSFFYQNRLIRPESGDLEDFLTAIDSMIKVESYDVPGQIIFEYFSMAREYLEFLFINHFVNTIAFKELTDQIVYHEESQFKLYHLNMTLFQMGILNVEQLFELEQTI